MEVEFEDGGLLNIGFDFDEERSAIEPDKKVPRDFQSQADFQQELKMWRPKVEIEEIWKSLKLPLDKPSKIESQRMLYAVEELYFLKRYEEALSFLQKALEGQLIDEFKSTLVRYRDRCKNKLANGKTCGREPEVNK